MDISTTNALTAISYGAAAGAVAMAAANVVLVGAGVSAKAGAFVADYFKNDSVAQNLRIKGDQLFSLAGKYAATELKVAAAMVAVGGSSALAQYAINENNDTCKIDRLREIQGMCFEEAEEAARDARVFPASPALDITPAVPKILLKATVVTLAVLQLTLAAKNAILDLRESISSV